MKKQVVSILATSNLFLMLAVTSAFAGSSTRTETHVPFDFTVGSKTLPAGTYTVEAWHEKLGTLTETVTLADNDSKTLMFTYKAPASAAP